MLTDIAIKVDEKLLDKVNRYALSKGRTISGLMERQLCGIVALPEDFDCKKELGNREI